MPVTSATVLASSAGIEWIRAWVHWGVALLDLSLWKMLVWPFVFAWQSMRPSLKTR